MHTIDWKGGSLSAGQAWWPQFYPRDHWENCYTHTHWKFWKLKNTHCGLERELSLLSASRASQDPSQTCRTYITAGFGSRRVSHRWDEGGVPGGWPSWGTSPEADFWPPHLCSYTHTGMCTHRKEFTLHLVTCLSHQGGASPTEAGRRELLNKALTPACFDPVPSLDQSVTPANPS